MTVESASDLASMFDEDEFAEAASYRPPGLGDPVICSVILDRGQGRSRFERGDHSATTSNRKLWVRAAEIAALARDGVFTMLDADGAPTGEIYTVAGLPELDHTGRLWSADLVEG